MSKLAHPAVGSHKVERHEKEPWEQDILVIFNG